MIARDIVIESRPGEIRAAALDDDGVPIAFEIERDHQRDGVGDVHIGRVISVNWALGHVFVDIGLPQSGFLNIPTDSASAGISDVLGAPICEGAKAVVQVNRAAEAGKGPRLTLRPEIDGQYLVATPGRPSLSISRRITNAAAVSRIRAALQDVVGEVGFVVRTSAADVDPVNLVHEAEVLRETWSNTQAAAKLSAAVVPAVLWRSPGILRHILWNWVGPKTNRIVFDDAAVADRFREIASSGHGVPQIDLLPQAVTAFSEFDIADDFAAQFDSVLPLPCGGRLIVQETAALTAVDVDMAQANNVVAVNVDAAEHLARALPLRGIGGIVVVDFLNMPKRQDREGVLSRLRSATEKDADVTSVSSFSRNGLVEIVRRRRRPSLLRQCYRIDRQPTPETLGLAALAEVRRAGGSKIGIKATRSVVMALTGPLSVALQETRAALAVDIQVESFSDVVEDRYEIVTGGE